MSRKDRDKDKKADKPAKGDKEQVVTSGWQEDRKPVWRKFPGPASSESYRVAFTREAYADVVAHAKENLESEVAGVLAGQWCEDEQGIYVLVQAIVPCTSTTSSNNVSVTWTQDTWNKIHERLDTNYPDMSIVGWYHTHPGFGVHFSDLDLFVQKNYFPVNGMVAFVTDPLGGDEAICVQADGDIRHVGRFWVDGRERTCRMMAATKSDQPAASDSDKDGAPPAQAPASVTKALEDVEHRLGQALSAIEELRTSYYRFLTFVGFLVALGVIFFIGWTVYTHFTAPLQPPETRAFMPGVVKVNDEFVWLGATPVVQPLPKDAQEKLRLMELQQKQAASAPAASAPSAPNPAAPPSTENQPK